MLPLPSDKGKYTFKGKRIDLEAANLILFFCLGIIIRD